MAVIYPTWLKNNRLSLSVTAIDAGTGNGVLRIGTDGMADILAEIELVKPSFTVASGSMTLNGVPLSDLDALMEGDATEAAIYDSDGNVVVGGLTVGDTSSGANIRLNSTHIQQNQEVRITGGTITHG